MDSFSDANMKILLFFELFGSFNKRRVKKVVFRNKPKVKDFKVGIGFFDKLFPLNYCPLSIN